MSSPWSMPGGRLTPARVLAREGVARGRGRCAGYANGRADEQGAAPGDSHVVGPAIAPDAGHGQRARGALLVGLVVAHGAFIVWLVGTPPPVTTPLPPLVVDLLVPEHSASPMPAHSPPAASAANVTTRVATSRTTVAAVAVTSRRVAEAPAAPAPANATSVEMAVSATTGVAGSAAASIAGAEGAFSPPRFDAHYLHNPPPVYPPLARRAGEDGKVVLRVWVNAQGGADSVELHVSSGSSRLDEAALKAVRQWTFVPAKRGDTPVASPVLVPILFRLES
ncbi:TonB family protein [Rhodocyclus tenuis]|uniref:energy transducer TonB n=1 Tax=Rhodocyclus gracilis TaxID=2929842 RepID=UPI0012989472|nr:energy transducer TonB [Rhodocyclus gracilis]MRD73666.1 TonB family protein [Rhodocyclus gracilis]